MSENLEAVQLEIKDLLKKETRLKKKGKICSLMMRRKLNWKESRTRKVLVARTSR